VSVHILLKIAIHELENEHEFVFGVYHIVESNDILVLEFFHEGDLADGGRRGAFFRVEMDFLKGYELAGLTVAAFEDLYNTCRR
jgi:hypothetical protein